MQQYLRMSPGLPPSCAGCLRTCPEEEGVAVSGLDHVPGGSKIQRSARLTIRVGWLRRTLPLVQLSHVWVSKTPDIDLGSLSNNGPFFEETGQNAANFRGHKPVMNSSHAGFLDILPRWICLSRQPRPGAHSEGESLISTIHGHLVTGPLGIFAHL